MATHLHGIVVVLDGVEDQICLPVDATLLTVHAEPGVDGIRALRALLKAMLRTCGLRCEKIQEVNSKGEMKMDMRAYASTYVKPDNVRDGPIQTRIVNVFESERFGRPVLELETGSQFMLNDGNTNTLIRAWGHNSDDWIGKEIELLLGTYKDWQSDPPVDKETVKVRAIETAAAANGGAPAANKPPLPPARTKASKDDMDDSIPFVLAFLITSAVTWFVSGGSNLIA